MEFWTTELVLGEWGGLGVGVLTPAERTSLDETAGSRVLSPGGDTIDVYIYAIHNRELRERP